MKIDLKKYFVKKRNNYYYENFSSILEDLDEYFVIDIEEAKNQFLYLLQPYNKDNQYDTNKFILICNFLNEEGYYIKEFPSFLERPTSRWDLSYNQIRNIIINETHESRVAWADRRTFISNMCIERKHEFKYSNNFDSIMNDIATSRNEFNKMSIDEKLMNICNAIEYLLKENGKFKIINYNFSNGFLSDEIVKKFRNFLEIFRHDTKEDITKRKELSDNQKKYFVELGISIIDYISSFVN